MRGRDALTYEAATDPHQFAAIANEALSEWALGPQPKVGR